MLPPRYVLSPNKAYNNVIKYNENHNNNIPYKKNNRQSLQKYHQSINNNNTITSNNLYKSPNKYQCPPSQSRSKYEHIKSSQQKRKALGCKKYINQLAQMDYEDKFIQIHTKYTVASRISVMKKIKAKNQIAQFIQQEQQQQYGFQQLMDYKYGNINDDNNNNNNNNNEKYYFQLNQIVNNYQYCNQCDIIHNDHWEVHSKMCKVYHNINNNQMQIYNKNNKQYNYYTLNRILKSINKFNSQQYCQLKFNIQQLIKIQQDNLNQSNQYNSRNGDLLHNCLKNIHDLYLVNQNDHILQKITEKILRDLYNKIR